MTNGILSVEPQILLEDDWLLVVNKPSGLATQAGKGATNTLEAWARSYLGPLATRNGFTVGAAHRLDKETSGVIVLAKRRPAMSKFMQALGERRVKKKYLALVKGVPAKAKDYIRTPLIDLHGTGGVPQEAVTRYEVLSQNGTASLVACFPETGRLHQIRRHFTAIRHPLACDEKYGDDVFSQLVHDRWGLSRLFLHAAALTFVHPKDDQKIEVRAPLPAELREVLAKAGLSAEGL